MTTLPCFYAPETVAHNPRFWILRGVPSPNKELPERADRLLAGLARLGLEPLTPPESDRAAMRAIHTPNYLDFLENCWKEWQSFPGAGAEVVANLHPQKSTPTYPEGIVGRAGWHMSDTACPIGRDTWAAAIRGVDTALAAAGAVMDGADSAYALCRPPGHHADADTAAGHCFLNNSAIAAQALLEQHDRVAILDIDVHHGNGTQEIFYDRADVLTVSIHASPEDFYPFYLGYAHETGRAAGEGCNLNLPLPKRQGDEDWLAAISSGLNRIEEFNPGAMVLALGLDAHENDPLRGLSVTTGGFGRAAKLIAEAGLPTVMVQEGGYLSDDLTENIHAFLAGWIGARQNR
ncbi:histone deacetylase family protein [Paracoccus onubensis]|uniref:Histone deacetylase family protein n=1 Tax=Paracoccus onubensis TaxID=1675788 RepID=A0A418SQ41_9RHOB|nr:histone deacetylase family protein [Paracoccus onubensis]RJE82957.1 histone deacetylase family protein [Paracoccus onubensis]